jgi:predicted RNA-binding protein
MRIWDAPQYIFNYNIIEVLNVFFNRYPNSYAGHIISEDVLSREITKDKIISRKLIVKNGIRMWQF